MLIISLQEKEVACVYKIGPAGVLLPNSSVTIERGYSQNTCSNCKVKKNTPC